MTRYLYDVQLFVTIPIEAESEDKAYAQVVGMLQDASLNAGCYEDGSPVLLDVGMIDGIDLVEVDGEPVY